MSDMNVKKRLKLLCAINLAVPYLWSGASVFAVAVVVTANLGATTSRI